MTTVVIQEDLIMQFLNKYFHLMKELIKEASNVVSFGSVIDPNESFSSNLTQILPTAK